MFFYMFFGQFVIKFQNRKSSLAWTEAASRRIMFVTASLIVMEGKTSETAGELLCSLQRRKGSGCKVENNAIVSIEGKSSMFSSGLTDPNIEETFEASEEECAKACYYSKR